MVRIDMRYPVDKDVSISPPLFAHHAPLTAQGRESLFIWRAFGRVILSAIAFHPLVPSLGFYGDPKRGCVPVGRLAG